MRRRISERLPKQARRPAPLTGVHPAVQFRRAAPLPRACSLAADVIAGHPAKRAPATESSGRPRQILRRRRKKPRRKTGGSQNCRWIGRNRTFARAAGFLCVLPIFPHKANPTRPIPVRANGILIFFSFTMRLSAESNRFFEKYSHPLLTNEKKSI